MKQYDRYKDSQIAWLGQIPEHWEEYYLSQCAVEQNISNKDVHHQNLLSLSYGSIKRKNINKTDGLLPASFDTYQIVHNGNIILRLTDLQNDKRSLRTGLATETGIITSAYVCLRCLKHINPSFLHKVLHTYDVKKLFYGLGGGLRQGCSYKDLKKLLVYAPSEGEQEQIVRYLDWKMPLINKYVREKKQEVSLLKEYIESLCFGGDGEESIFVTQWCPKLPSEWRKVAGKRIFTERKIKNCPDEEMLAVTQDRGVVFKSLCSQNYITAEDTSSQKLVKQCDYVISLRSFQGGIEFSNIQGVVSPAYNIFLLKDKYCSKELQTYYRFLFKSKPFISLLFSMGGGIRDGKNISFSDFAEIELPLPPQNILDKILKLSIIYDTLNLKLVDTIRLMDEYKTRLISDVVTGKVDVRAVKIPKYAPEQESAE